MSTFSWHHRKHFVIKASLRRLQSKSICLEQFFWPQKFKQSYLSELDSLAHEDGDLCGVGGGRVSVSVGERPENKTQTELSSTPFH